MMHRREIAFTSVMRGDKAIGSRVIDRTSTPCLADERNRIADHGGEEHLLDSCNNTLGRMTDDGELQINGLVITNRKKRPLLVAHERRRVDLRLSQALSHPDKSVGSPTLPPAG